jgi:indole-3-glycerol phosphate synthase
MADILKKIIDQTGIDLMERKRITSLAELRSMTYYKRNPLSLKDALTKGSGIIAEHKRRSPSKGSFECPVRLKSVVQGYENAGASAISCLTDEPFFGGTLKDLTEARQTGNIPILRKDFMIDLYQVHESKAYGADAILLIAACLNHEQLMTLSMEAVNLGLSILFEVHNKEELDVIKKVTASLPQHSYVIGVNNRDLTQFTTDVNISMDLLKHFPPGVVAVSESGISDPEVVNKLKTAGFTGFLIGEHFMKSDDPGASCSQFIKKLDHVD